ncbi:MAG: hypothetical protein QOJ64_1797 [Acidobacteriota bacterium]|jgi:hypothetical protein|nr:hypothetical protein [Acidobacteriota bacterium]
MIMRTNPLDSVSVAAPCTAGWDNMIGDEQVRFCGQCNLNVYNLSGMTKQAAERVIAHTEGRLCIRYFRRADGTILTKNCPVGLRAIRRRVTRVATSLASAALSFFAGILMATGLRERTLDRPESQQLLIRSLENLPLWPKPRPDVAPMMGAMAPIDGEHWVNGDMVLPVRPDKSRVPHR